MSTENDRPRADQREGHERRQVDGAASPRNRLAVDDPSTRRRATDGRPGLGGGHPVSVEWVRPVELAARVAGKAAAGTLAAHLAAHRRLREGVRARLAWERPGRPGRLAPGSAFGHGGQAEPVAPARSVLGR